MKTNHHASRAVWTLIDQGIASLGNFLTYIILARQLVPVEYGTFALLIGAFLALQILPSTILFYPLSLRLQQTSGPARNSILRTNLILVIIFLVPLTAVLALTLLALDRGDLIPAAVACSVAWQIQEGTRRSLLATFRIKDALIGDAIAYIGRVVLLLILSRQMQITIPLVLWTMTTTSVASTIVQALQLRLTPGPFVNVLDALRDF